MTFSWILFDADGVLQTLAPGWLDDLTAWGGEDFVVALFGAERRSMAGAEDFRAVAREVMTDFGVAVDLEDVVSLPHRIVVDQAMLDEIGRLRTGGLRCGLATNQQNVRGAYMRGSLPYGRFLDAQFYSYELGFAKPDPAYFRTIMGRLGVPSEQVLFVDDKEANVMGAREAGLVAELFPFCGGVGALRSILSVHGLT